MERQLHEYCAMTNDLVIEKCEQYERVWKIVKKIRPY